METKVKEVFVTVSHKMNLGDYESAEVSMGEVTTVLDGDPTEVRTALYLKVVGEVMEKSELFRAMYKRFSEVKLPGFKTADEIEPVHGEDAHKLEEDYITDGQVKYLKSLAEQGHADEIDEVLSNQNCKTIKDLTKRTASKLIDKLVKLNGKK